MLTGNNLFFILISVNSNKIFILQAIFLFSTKLVYKTTIVY